MLVSRALLGTLIDLSDHPGRALARLMDDTGLEVKGSDDIDGDTILHVETLANRGDHASHHGVATELSGRLLRAARLPDLAELPAAASARSVRIETPLCPRYTLLDLPAYRLRPTSADMAALLRRLGSDVYNEAADVTNFVSLELGQPMHAFDRRKVAGEVRVEELAEPADVLALDSKTYRLPAGAIVIRDAEKIIAVAGIIGCLNSSVSEGTEGILLESAIFDPVRVRTTARAMKISTRASFRFERGADSEMAEIGQRRALQLLGAPLGPAPGSAAAGYTDCWPGRPGPRLVPLRLSFLARYLGVDLGRALVESRLSCLGFRLHTAPLGDTDTLLWEVPPRRQWDVETEQDLIEEVAKSQGYNALPDVLPSILPGGPARTARDELEDRALGVLVAAGFHEVIAPSLHGPELTEGLPVPHGHPLRRFVTTTNSLESAFSTLRNTCVTVLCRLLRENAARGVTDAKIFERGVTFHPDDQHPADPGSRAPTASTGVAERWVLAAAACGRWYARSFRDSRETDPFFMKGVVESLGDAVGVKFDFALSEHPLLQPFARADILLEERAIGAVGAVHPEVAGGLEGGATYFEIELAPLLPFVEQLPRYRAPHDFPSSTRDVTWLVPDGRGDTPAVSAAAVEAAMRAVAGPLLVDLRVLSVYRAGPDSTPRITWRLEFQSPERTLRREEVDTILEAVVLRVQDSLALARG